MFIVEDFDAGWTGIQRSNPATNEVLAIVPLDGVIINVAAAPAQEVMQVIVLNQPACPTFIEVDPVNQRVGQWIVGNQHRFDPLAKVVTEQMTLPDRKIGDCCAGWLIDRRRDRCTARGIDFKLLQMDI